MINPALFQMRHGAPHESECWLWILFRLITSFISWSSDFPHILNLIDDNHTLNSPVLCSISDEQRLQRQVQQCIESSHESAHCNDVRLYSLPIQIDTRTTSHCWTRLQYICYFKQTDIRFKILLEEKGLKCNWKIYWANIGTIGLMFLPRIIKSSG